MRETILGDHESCSVQKTFRKNTKYSRNETILKIGHFTKPIAHVKVIAFAKWSVWVKNLKYQKHARPHCRRTLELFCAKKPFQKTPNIREMTRF